MGYIKIPGYARLKGVTPEYVRRLIIQGKITKASLKKHGKRWQINSDMADQDLDNNLSYINRKQNKPVKGTIGSMILCFMFNQLKIIFIYQHLISVK